MSVLVNTKSDRHRKTQEVEPDETGRKFEHLTRGELLGESQAAVSRGRSSEESGRKPEGAKDQRTKRQTNQTNSGPNGARSLPKQSRSDKEKITSKTGLKELWRVELTKDQKTGGEPGTRRTEVQEGAE